MKIQTCNSMKGRRARDLTAKPREGTHIREFYDLLMANKGHVVDVRSIPLSPQTRAQLLTQLAIVYGLDIRLVRHFNYMLVGEWCDTVYIDYLAESLEKDETNGGSNGL